MKEYLTQAIVLRTRPRGEFDRWIDLYTKSLGRVGARVVGGRRFLSKLAPHLEPWNLAEIRLVQKGGFTVADALLKEKFSAFLKNPAFFAKINDLIFLVRELTPKTEPDLRLWHELRRALETGKADLRLFLKLLGYDPALAVCEVCGSRRTAYFHVGDQTFLCSACRRKFPGDKLILID